MSRNPAQQLYSLLPIVGANAFSDYYPVPVSLGMAGNQFSDYYWMCIDAMLTDDEVRADLELRHATSFMTPYKVVATPDDLNFVNDVLADFDTDTLLEQCLYHADYGFNPVELDWKKSGGIVRPVVSERRHPRSFRWGKNGELLYSATGGGTFDFQPVITGKVIPVVRNGSREKPYGESVLEAAWATWQTKWTHVEQLERLAAKYSVPSTVALTGTDGAVNQESIQNIADQMAAIDGGGSVALAGVSELVQLTASGKASELMGVIKDYDNKLSKLITGQTLTSGNQQYGSRALGEVHERASLKITVNDARTTYTALNRTLFKWIFQFNNHPGSLRLEFDKEKFQVEMMALQGNLKGGITLSDPTRRQQRLQRSKGLCL